MPVFNTPQPGPYRDSTLNLTSLHPGDTYVLLDGSEDVAEGDSSVAFARGLNDWSDNGITFVARGMTAGDAIDIQAANGREGTDPTPPEDGDYFTVNTITPDANGNGGYTDVGRSAFYRANLATFSEGNDTPIVTVQR